MAHPVGALDLAARRYRVDRIAHWQRVYGALRAARPSTFASSYIDDDDRTFPRYHVLAAIRSAIERWTPDEAASAEAARERLIEAARTAESAFTRPSPHALATEAMAEERAAFERFARESSADDWTRAEALPFRRVLAEADADARYGGAIDAVDSGE